MALELASTAKNAEKTAPSIGRRFSLPTIGAKVTAKDRMFFTEQLALLLETGSSLHAALQALRRQTDNPALAEIVGTLLTDIAEGQSFSRALSRHPQVFSATYVNLIAAGENGGFMDQVLGQLLVLEEKREALRSTVTSAFSYPAFLLLFSSAVVVFVLVVVFPKFGTLFESIKDQLPITTVALMAASDVLRNHWHLCLGGLTAGVLAFRYWLQSPSGSVSMDRLKLSIPGLKHIFIQLYLAQTLRVMGLSLQNGVSIVDTLHACKDVARNKIFQRFLAGLETNVQDGAGIAVGFKQADLIPPIVEHMVSTGEESGNLAKVMQRLSDFYERELQKKLTTLSKMAEPVMLLVMGVLVGIIVSSLILPIFKLSRAVG